jgi:hypothetical protein
VSTLANIRTKVRRLTGRPSPQQITDAQIDDYINTFYIYDMPETLRLFSQKTVFEFMTEANVAEYDLRTMQVWTGASNQPAVDVYISLSPPGYIAGYQSFWSQDREQFLRTYPALAQIKSSIEGNGTPGPYTITFANTPVLQYQVTVGAIDDTDSVINLVDNPTNRTNGTWLIINSNVGVTGSINYLTGQLSVTFPNNIPAGNQITFTGVPYEPSRPQAILFYDNIITLRPVPDASYLVTTNAYRRPTILIDSGDFPELKQWWQYLAFGASKKIFEDSQDAEGMNSILPGLKEQERLVLRRTIIERTNQRSATIYTEMTGYPYGNFNNRN